MKKNILKAVLTLGYISCNPLAASEEIDGLGRGQYQRLDGADQHYLKWHLFDGKTGGIHFVQKGVRIVGTGIPDNIKRENENNPSVYNPKTRKLVSDANKRITTLDQLEGPSALEAFFTKDRTASIAGGISGFFIANTFFDYFLKKPSEKFAVWVVPKFIPQYKTQNLSPDKISAISLTLRVLFNSCSAIGGYYATSQVMKKIAQ